MERISTYDVGLCTYAPHSFSARYALPNKFFDSLQARLCIAIGPLPEMKRLVERFDCGVVAEDFTPHAHWRRRWADLTDGRSKRADVRPMWRRRSCATSEVPRSCSLPSVASWDSTDNCGQAAVRCHCTADAVLLHGFFTRWAVLPEPRHHASTLDRSSTRRDNRDCCHSSWIHDVKFGAGMVTCTGNAAISSTRNMSRACDSRQ